MRMYLDVLDLLLDRGGEAQLSVGLPCEGHHEVVDIATRSHHNKFIWPKAQHQHIGPK